MFKSFSFPVVIAALAAAAVVHAVGRDRSAIWLALVTGGSIAVALPWILAILPFNQAENRGAVPRLEWLWLVRRMLLKTDLTGSIEAFLAQTLGIGPNAYAILTVATLIFLVGGLGTRLIGVVALWRAAVGHANMRMWTPLAWIVIVGVAVSFAITVAPFPNSIQTYMFALFAMWPFAASTIWQRGAAPSAWRWAASALLLCASAPATVHYVRATHAAARGAPLTGMDEGDFKIVRYLRGTDDQSTLLLHSNPLWPSLYTIEAQRRVVLGWSSYLEGDGNPEVDALSAEIARFFGSSAEEGADDLSLLRRFHVTHVVERPAKDRLHPHVVQQLRLVTGTPTCACTRCRGSWPRDRRANPLAGAGLGRAVQLVPVRRKDHFVEGIDFLSLPAVGNRSGFPACTIWCLRAAATSRRRLTRERREAPWHPPRRGRRADPHVHSRLRHDARCRRVAGAAPDANDRGSWRRHRGAGVQMPAAGATRTRCRHRCGRGGPHARVSTDWPALDSRRWLVSADTAAAVRSRRRIVRAASCAHACGQGRALPTRSGGAGDGRAPDRGGLPAGRRPCAAIGAA